MTYLTGNCDIEFELPKEVQFSFLCRLWIEREKKLNGSNLVFFYHQFQRSKKMKVHWILFFLHVI